MRNRGVSVLIFFVVLGILLFFVGVSLTGYAVYDASAGNSTIYECGTINAAGTYTLNQSMNSTSSTFYSCISINASNVILDGNGYSLACSSQTICDGFLAIGIYVNGKVNVTIKNFTNISGFYEGIRFYRTNRSVIYNVSLINNSDNGLYMYYSNFNNLSNLNAYYSGAEGIYSSEGINNSFSFINSSFNENDGISLNGGAENWFYETETNGNSEYGLTFSMDYNTTITKATSKNNTEGGISLVSDGAVIENSSFDNNNLYGLATLFAINIRLFNNSFNSNSVGTFFIDSGLINMSYNNMSNNRLANFALDGAFIGAAALSLNNTIDLTNSIDGKYIYYNYSISNYVYNITTAPNAGTIICGECSNITVEGLNISGRAYAGVQLGLVSNSTVRNVTFERSYLGLYLFNATNTLVTNITSSLTAAYGALIYYSNNVSVEDVNVRDNTGYGLILDSSTRISMKRNNMTNNVLGNFGVVDSSDLSDGSVYNHSIDTSNIIDGSYYIYYNYSISNYVYNTTSAPNAGTVICAMCSNVIVKDLNLSHQNYYGAYLRGNSGSFNLTNVSASSNYYGIYLYGSLRSRITNVIANNNQHSGIYLVGGSSANNFSEIVTNYNNDSGIYLDSDSNNNTFFNISSSYNGNSGLYLYESSYNYFNNLSLNYNNFSGAAFYDYSNSNIVNNTRTRYNNISGYLYLSDRNNFSYYSSAFDNHGFYLDYSSDSNLFDSFVLHNNSLAIYLDYADWSNFSRGVINDSSSYSIYDDSGYKNSFKNLSFASSYSNNLDLYLHYSFREYIDDLINVGKYNFTTDSDELDLYVTRTGFGRISLLYYEDSFGYNFSRDIVIGNNSAYVNSSVSGLNVSANVTLYNLPSARGYVGTVILRDGGNCSASICTALTNIRDSNVTFSVTGWSNYSIYRGVADSTAPVVTQNSPTVGITTATIKFDVSDLGVIANCTAYVSGTAHHNTSEITAEDNRISITSLTGNTSYSSYVNCTDEAGNRGNSSTRTWTTSADDDDGGDPDSPAPGATANFWTSTYNYYDLELMQKPPITRFLKNGHRIGVKISGSTHYVGVVELTSAKVVINVTSNPQQAIFYIGDSKKFDVTNDGIYDLEVKLNSINGTTNANITVLYAGGAVVVTPVVPNSSGNNSANLNTSLSNQSNNNTGGTTKKSSVNLRALLIFVLIIVFIVAVGVTIYFVINYYKNKPKVSENLSQKIRKLQKPGGTGIIITGSK